MSGCLNILMYRLLAIEKKDKIAQSVVILICNRMGLSHDGVERRLY